MSLAKAIVTGTVYRNPEKRFTSSNIAIYSLTLNIGENDEILVRVISKRKALEGILDKVRQGDKILVGGRLQVATSKYLDGSDKRFYEIDASNVELIQSNGANPENITEIGVEQPSMSESSDVDDDEIPF